MAVLFAFTIDTRAAEAALRRLGDQAALAMARALNRTAKGAETDAVRAIAENMRIKQQDVRKSMRLKRATQTLLQAEVVATGKRIPLLAFRARGPIPSRGKGGGVRYDLGAGRSLAPHAFIATMRSGHRGVFQRKPGAGRAPIYELKGPSIPKVFGDRTILSAIQARAERDLVTNLEHEIAYLLRSA